MTKILPGSEVQLNFRLWSCTFDTIYKNMHSYLFTFKVKRMPESLFQSFDVVADNILKMGQILVQPICKSQQGQYLSKSNNNCHKK